MNDLHEIEVLLRSKTSFIVFETHEESHALMLLIRLAIKLRRPLHRWTSTEGLERVDIDMSQGTQKFLRQPGEVLGHIKAVSESGIFVLMDFHPFLDEPLHVRHLKDIALRRDVQQTVVMVSHQLPIPPELAPFCARFELSMPDAVARETLVREEAKIGHGDIQNGAS